MGPRVCAVLVAFANDDVEYVVEQRADVDVMASGAVKSAGVTRVKSAIQ